MDEDDDEEARRNMVDGSRLNMFCRRVEVRLAWETQVAAARKDTRFGGTVLGWLQGVRNLEVHSYWVREMVSQ